MFEPVVLEMPMFPNRVIVRPTHLSICNADQRYYQGRRSAEVLAKNPNQLEQYRGGKVALFGFFVGQTMKAMGGKAVPEFKVGDSVKVYVKIKEGDKERVQAFAGTVIARDGGKSNSATFTVRRISFGVGVEKVFPLYSPYIDKVEVFEMSYDADPGAALARLAGSAA